MMWVWIAFVFIALFIWLSSKADREDSDPGKPSVDRALRAAQTYEERRRTRR